MLISLFFLAALASPGPGTDAACKSLPCSCVKATSLGQTPTEFVLARRDRAERVVLGTVVRIDTLPLVTWGSGEDAVSGRPVVARLKVRRAWRGPAVDTMTVQFRNVGPRWSCEFTLRLGVSYIVFAAGRMGALLSTHYCSGTEREADAAATLSALGPGRPATR